MKPPFITYMGRLIGATVLTPRVWLFISVLALFPFISTVIGVSLKVAGLEVWKYLWLAWLGMLAIHVLRSKSFFDNWGGRLETLYWLFIAFMLVLAPKAELVIDPWKNWFFCTLAIVLFRLIAVANADEIRTMVKSALGLWWAYALILIVYAKSNPNYPGSIQHQFFLSGLLGLVAGLLLLRSVIPASEPRPGHGLYPFLLVTMLVNVVLNLTITETRSIFPFSLALVLVAAAWLLRSTMRPAPRVALRIGLPLALLLTLLPLLHLSGTMGNLVNELAYPIFGKLRTIESKSGREAAFQLWSRYVADNGRLLGPANKPLPTVEQEVDHFDKPLFGLTPDQLTEIKSRGMKAQKTFADRQHALGVEIGKVPAPEARRPSEVSVDLQSAPKVDTIKPSGPPAPPAVVAPVLGPVGELAITSSHNQWLDAAARSGLLYAAAIAWAFGYVAWLISARLSLALPLPLVFAYWAMAVAWGFASQFDDEHWLYHIPYLTLFFVPVIVTAGCMRETQPAIKAPA